jgi:hypothetical protein
MELFQEVFPVGKEGIAAVGNIPHLLLAYRSGACFLR